MRVMNVSQLWTSALEACLKRERPSSSRVGDAREVIGWSCTVENPLDRWTQNQRRALSLEYASAELLWYMLRTDEVKWLLPYAPQYENFAEPGTGRAFGAYGYRLANNVQGMDLLNYVVAKIARIKDTRQAVIALWRPSDVQHIGVKKDLPCTLTWQFLLRDDALHLVVNMRSNDVWLGLPYDAYVNTCIQELAANTLGVRVGTYVHNAGSLHLYEKNWHAACEAIEVATSGCPRGQSRDDLLMGEDAAEMWRRMQQGSWCPSCVNKFSSLLSPTLKAAASKFGW